MAPFSRVVKRQNSSKIHVTILTLQTLILLKSRPNKCQFVVENRIFKENFPPIPDSMADSISWVMFEHSSPNLTNKVYANVYPVLRHAVDQISAKELYPMG